MPKAVGKPQDFIVVGIGIAIGRYAGASEVEQIHTAAINAMQRYVGLTGHNRIHNADEVRYVHAHSTLCRVEQNLWRRGIGGGLCLVAANRYALSNRNRVDTQVAEPIAIFKNPGFRTDFHNDVIVKVCAAI